MVAETDDLEGGIRRQTHQKQLECLEGNLHPPMLIHRPTPIEQKEELGLIAIELLLNFEIHLNFFDVGGVLHEFGAGLLFLVCCWDFLESGHEGCHQGDMSLSLLAILIQQSWLLHCGRLEHNLQEFLLLRFVRHCRRNNLLQTRPIHLHLNCIC